jgi:DNA polymerase-2
MESTLRAFILTADWQDGTDGLELDLWVKNDQGPLKLRFTGQKQVFFIPRESKFSPRFAFERKNVQLKSFDGKDVDAIYLNEYRHLSQARSYCESQGIRTYEMDIRPNERFLMERFINGQVEWKETTLNPNVRQCDYSPQLSMLSLDIETGVEGELYSIAMHLRGKVLEQTCVLMIGNASESNEDVTFFASEKELLQQFITTFNQWDPDILVGWHVIGFDLMFLEKKCLHNNLELTIGRSGDVIKLEQRSGGFFAKMQGRVVLDGPPTLRASFYSFKNFKLETVAQEVLGSGKDISEGGSDKVEEIERRFKEDKLALAKYNLMDCTLVLDIFDKLRILDLMVTRVQISGMLMDRLGISTAAFDHLLLPRLHRKGFVAPNTIDIERDEASTGGMVFSPITGLHENVAVFDFKSLYPSIIRTFKIDPFSLLQKSVDTLNTPSGHYFSKTQNLLPSALDELMEKRAMAKRNHNKALSQAIKILMNSFYGVMGSSRCRFYHSDLPSAITQTGHWILKTGMEFFANRDLQVLYGDTDSLFVKLPLGQGADEAAELAQTLNHYLNTIIQDEYGVTSHLELEFEKLYQQLFFPVSRQSNAGAKKRYCGISDEQIQFVGMEFVRSDWTELAKEFQFALYQQLFKGHSLDEVIKDTIKRLEAGEYDDKLVITKKLSKDPKEYTKNIPPHVQAALKINHTGPYRLKEVSYVMCQEGPVPLQLDPKNLDYQYYLERQLKPIADDLLKYFDQSFDNFLVGDQLSLF